jgi:hypothetical protein
MNNDLLDVMCVSGLKEHTSNTFEYGKEAFNINCSTLT